MKKDSLSNLKQSVIEIGALLWEKDLASGLNGNVSVRVDAKTLLLTGHGTCLGRLTEKEILPVTVEGEVVGSGKCSTEKLLHTEIYKNFPQIKAVVHTHTTYTSAYFLENTALKPRIFETKIYLGEVVGVAQHTPAVTDAKPVIAALQNNNIVVLRNHGVVAMGENLFDCFCLIQALEDACKIDAISRLYLVGNKLPSQASGELVTGNQNGAKDINGKYKLFSQEQMDKIVDVVNKDSQLAQLGEKTNMTFEMAVKLDETGQTYKFCFEKGRIAKMGKDADAEFVVSAPEKVWRSVFNREIDPFVATTQKKMNLKGDLAKLSKWYAPCSRVFQLWQRVPVE